MISPKTLFRMIMTVLMACILAGLLIWQDARYRLVNDCHARGGHWHGPTSRCRPVPPIYLERGLKRT